MELCIQILELPAPNLSVKLLKNRQGFEITLKSSNSETHQKENRNTSNKGNKHQNVSTMTTGRAERPNWEALDRIKRTVCEPSSNPAEIPHQNCDSSCVKWGTWASGVLPLASRRDPAAWTHNHQHPPSDNMGTEIASQHTGVFWSQVKKQTVRKKGPWDISGDPSLILGLAPSQACHL